MRNGANWILENATIVDGTGSPPVFGRLVIRNGRIAEIAADGDALTTEAESDSRRIDCEGAVVSPGFIDVHSHADISPMLDFDDTTKILQGVTTEVVGNCGSTVAPLNPANEDALKSTIGKSYNVPEYRWHTFAEYLEVLDGCGFVTNACPLVGHGAIRAAAMGARGDAASDADLDAMRDYLDEALDAGAFGLSCGLIYPPGVFSDSHELGALAERLEPHHTLACHMRNEADELLPAIHEICEAARIGDANLQISHLKASGTANWNRPQAPLDLIRLYRDAGVDVTIDVYPYMAASTKLSACLPPWVLAGGADAALARIRDLDTRAKIRAVLEAPSAEGWDSSYHNAGPDGIRIATSRTHRYDGMSLAQIAAQLGVDPLDALFTVLEEEAMSVTMLEFSMDESDMIAFLSSELAMVGSDGMTMSQPGKPHPRLTGTYPLILSRYVREHGVMPLERAIHKMTGMPAAKFRVPDRGVIAPGAIADLVCFDPDTIQAGSTYEHPMEPPVGIHWVMQAGQPVVQHGRWLGVRRGERLVPQRIGA